MKKGKTLKICLAASAGGHMSQLLMLSSDWGGYDAFYVTTTEVMRGKLKKLGKAYVVGESNRQHPWRVMKVFGRCVRIIVRERPQVIISTGAAAGCMLCFLGKLSGAKVIWVDSVTNVDRPSLSGRMVRLIADLFIVQWPDLAKKYKNAEYVGAII